MDESHCSCSLPCGHQQVKVISYPLKTALFLMDLHQVIVQTFSC